MSFAITQQIIPGLPTDVLNYVGVVAHSTADPGATAQDIATYFHNNWQKVQAFTHFVVDKDQIIQLAPVNIQCWGAGPSANKSYVQVELCEYKDDVAAAKQAYEKYCWLLAHLLFDKKLGVTDGGTLMSHAQVSAKWHETDHTDPIGYLSTVGMTWQDVVNGVTWDYADMVKLATPAPAPVPQPPPAPAPTPAPQSMGTPILGNATATVDQMRAFLWSINPYAPDYAQIYLDMGAKYGIAGDLVFIQSIKETGAWKFGGQVSPSQNNFAGLGATNGGAAGASFDTPAQGIEAQFQHAYGYATTNDLPAGTTLLDPRFSILQSAGLRGKCPTWESLDGHWAVPGNGYGESIVSQWKQMCAVMVDKSVETVSWMVSNNFLDAPVPPTTFVTVAQLGQILQKVKGGQ